MYAAGIHVRQGEYVTAGQHIADVGADGKSTAPHLHFEIRPGSAYSTPVNPELYLAGTQTADPPSAASTEPC